MESFEIEDPPEKIDSKSTSFKKEPYKKKGLDLKRIKLKSYPTRY